MTEPLPEPVDGLNNSHEAVVDALQVVLDATATDVDSEYHDAAVQDDIPKVKVFDPDPAPGWVTDTVCVTCGEPLVVVNVTVADRDAVAVLA
jgi:hypothetical protein